MRGWITGVCLIVVAVCLTAVSWAQQNDASKANDLFQAGKRIDALPLYENLAKSHPDTMIYQERLADCLGAAARQTNDPEQVKALRIRMKEAAKRAIALGDDSNYIQLMADFDLDAPVKIAAASSGGELLQEAEKAYAAGDFQTAMTKYVAAAEADPHLYEAPLFAGDTAYTQHDLPTAAHWFARAIEIDPNRETAYRYWGDAIFRLGNDPEAAENKFIDAIVAEPYDKFAWQGLQQWAVHQKAVLLPPKIDLPAPPAVDPKKPNNITININPADDLNKNKGSAAWLAYSMQRALYRGDEFKKKFPNEKEYRHSLKEEEDALSVAVSVLKELKLNSADLDESLRNLLELNDAGMLDCWILINDADQGIAQDYEAYRDPHRKLLHDYIAKYVVHGGVNPQP